MTREIVKAIDNSSFLLWGSPMNKADFNTVGVEKLRIHECIKLLPSGLDLLNGVNAHVTYFL